MKVKVIRTFTDKYTKENYKKNAVIDLTKERFEEVNSTSFGLLVEKIEQAKALSDLTVKELKEKAKDEGLENYSDLKKDELIALLEK